jgi:predicted permease
MLARLIAGIRGLARRHRIDSDGDEELRFHLEHEIQANLARGMSPTEARRVALRDLGGVTHTRKAVRDVRTIWLDSLWQDVCYALRSFQTAPGFAAVAILTLALGIGAVTAIFTVANAVVFRPLPFPDSDRLVSLEVTPKSATSMAIGVFSYPLFADVRDQADAFDGVATFQGAGMLTSAGHAESLAAAHASPALFRILGASTVLGRLPESRDERAGAPHVAVISYGAWVGYFGSDHAVLGRALVPKTGTGGRDESATIVGVLAPAFVFPYPRRLVEYDAWLPITPDVAAESEGAVPRSTHMWPVIGRLKAGVSLATAQRELDAIAARLAAAYPATDKDNGLRATRLHDKIVGKAGAPLLAFLASVGFLLLIACANVANLLLARANSRRREFAVRAALGAGRLRIARQVLTESAVLSLAGGAAGLAFASWAFRAFVALSPEMPRLNEASIDYRVLAFAFLAVTLSALLSGLAAAARCSRASVADALARAGGHTAGRRSRSISLTVVAELGIALVLLVGGGLMVNSFVRLLRFDLGFNPTSVVALDLSQPPLRIEGPRAAGTPQDDLQRRQIVVLTDRRRQIAALNEDMLRRISALPGVVAAATTTRLPLDRNRGFMDVALEGRPTPPGAARMVDIRTVSSDYFHALGIRFASGRPFTGQDREGAPPVVVVNETMARRLWPGESAVGKSVFAGAYGPRFQVAGVMADVRHTGATEPVEPEMYIADAQDPRPSSTLVVRTSGSAAVVARAVQAEMKRAGLQVGRVRVLEEMLADMLAPSRFSTSILATFSLLALVLALVGVYGVLSYSVAQRTHEIGVRMALGSGTRGVFRLVLGRALGHATIGVVVGLAGAVALGRFLQAMLFQVSPTDAATLACVCLLLIAGVVLAAYAPARRATRIDPIAALRCE